MGGDEYTLPAGCFMRDNACGYENVLMAMPTRIDADGVRFSCPLGTRQEMADLDASYKHLCKMRDEIIALGIIPPVSEWSSLNPNL